MLRVWLRYDHLIIGFVCRLSHGPGVSAAPSLTSHHKRGSRWLPPRGNEPEPLSLLRESSRQTVDFGLPIAWAIALIEWPKESIFFRHPTNAKSIAWQDSLRS
jgi:hypothetical protein